MVGKSGVLLGIQHLEHSRRGVAPEIVSHFVDLIQQNQRIAGAGPPDGRHDPPRHGADIGFAVAADIGLVPDAAE